MGAATSREGDAAREHTKQCRERRRLMREAVRLRGHLADSHAAYLRSLGVVASTLTRFAVGEPLPVSNHNAPAVIVHRTVAPSSPPPLLRAIEQRQREARQQQQQEGASAVDDVVGAAAAAAATARTEGGVAVGVGGSASVVDVGAEAAAAARTVGGVVGGTEGELRMEVKHRSLAEVAAGLEEYFVKAIVAGDAVSGLLETSTTKYKRGSHSFVGVLCCLSAPALDRIDSMSGHQRHSETLQLLLAWEKQLYKDVKAREKFQRSHDKKWAELQGQEYSRKTNVDIQKIKAAWNMAHVQLEAASQSVAASSSVIAELRDNHLARQLLGLCHATLDMWRAMRQHHEAQSLIAQQLRGLSSGTSTEPTTEIHYQATRALVAAMNAWHAAMAHMAKNQRDYVHAIHGWLKLTLTPVNGAAEESPVAAQLAAFVERWGKVHDAVHCFEVLESIKGFAGAIHTDTVEVLRHGREENTVHALQSNELRVARRVRKYSRKLDRKSRMLRQVEKSYYDPYLLGGMLMSLRHWGRPAWREEQLQAHHARTEVAQRRDEIEACRKMFEDEMRKHAKAIDATRTATVTAVQGKLPAVFQAMAEFSASLANSLEAMCRAPPQNADMQ